MARPKTASLVSSVAALLCVACTQAEDGRTPNEPAAERAADFASQIDPPLPDYAALLAAQAPIVPRDRSIEPSEPPPPDAKAIGQTWIDRLRARDALDGIGFSEESEGKLARLIDTRMSREEFDRLVAANGWEVPRHIAFHFVDPVSYPQVSADAKPRIRIWPAQTGRTGMQNMAALSGKVFVRDGCFFVRKSDGTESLAWFLAETGLAQDDEGYLTLIDRRTGWTLARVGEPMTWAGPNALTITDEQKAALFEACGEHPIESVGNPESEERLMVQLPHLREGNPPPPVPQAPPSAD